VSHFVARMILPAEFEPTREQFNSRWVMSAAELIRAPVEVWRSNLEVVADYIGDYYSWMTVTLIFPVLWFGVRQKRFPDLVLTIMCLSGGGAVILLLRGFNEYIFNTAIIAVLLPLLARGAFVIRDLGQRGNLRWIRISLLVCAGILIVNWGYQLALMSSSPG